MGCSRQGGRVVERVGRVLDRVEGVLERMGMFWTVWGWAVGRCNLKGLVLLVEGAV